MRHRLRTITHGFANRNEVNWNGFRALVKELKVGVLRIAARTTKYHWR